MNLTDLIPPGQLHRFLHKEESNEDREKRVKRIKEAYFKDMLKCIQECGANTNNANLELAITMSTICFIDKIIEIATGKVQ